MSDLVRVLVVYLVLDHVYEVDHPVPLLRVRELEDVLLVSAVRGVVRLDLQGEPTERERGFLIEINVDWDQFLIGDQGMSAEKIENFFPTGLSII